MIEYFFLEFQMPFSPKYAKVVSKTQIFCMGSKKETCFWNQSLSTCLSDKYYIELYKMEPSTTNFFFNFFFDKNTKGNFCES